MTKKDYELFANWLNKHKTLLTDYSKLEDLNQSMFDYLIHEIGLLFHQDNPLFQAAKFERACYEGKHIRKSIKNA